MKPKVRLLIAVVCWVGGLLLLISGMGMGMVSQWAGWSWVLLPLGGALVVVAILLSIPRKNTGK